MHEYNNYNTNRKEECIVSDIYWETFTSKRSPRIKDKTPIITITKDSGRISINVAACSLIEKYYSYSDMEILKGIDGKAFRKVGFKLLPSPSAQSKSISRKTYKGREVGGSTIYSKALVKDIYAQNERLPKNAHFHVESKSVSNSPTLIFDIFDSVHTE